ncbi:hypothetical protein SAMN04489743_2839 [Pseudarthrobacter equi]|uniref:Phage minor structural protein GP20 n=1 Tax=Pseudarthrobacter equi TaxID=728066 RepID=A0A1H2A9D3_9MICC|nr:hypothetical protein [Pseudarthrobacter equi]SDT42096.1 hypothetical protein SAMN04489743_2839 [Pseudarthrobacter equi]
MNSSTALLHGTIDPASPDFYEQLRAFHYATFGDAVMEADGDAPSGDVVDPDASKEPASTEPTKWDGDIKSLPTEVQTYISNLNKESASKRVSAKEAKDAQKATLDAISKALGYEVEDGKQLDATALAADVSEKNRVLAEKDARINELLTDAALRDAVLASKASPLTVSVLRGEGKLAGLDPAADDFASKIEALVADAVKRHPSLKGRSSAGTSGPDLTGADGDTPITQEAFNKMDAFERNALLVSHPTTYRKLSGRN